MAADGTGAQPTSDEVVLRTTADWPRVDRWAVVLASQGISSRVVATGDGWILTVRPEDGPAGLATLALYERENAPYVERSFTSAGLPWRTAAAWSLALSLGLVLLHTLQYVTDHRSWIVAGSASAAAIRAGEVWRATTALTLHADVGHVLSNAVIGAFFGVFLMRSVGFGVALAAVVATGSIGNVLNAWVAAPGHHSIGASTAVFGAIGLIAGLRAAQEITAAAERPAGVGPWRGLRSPQIWIPVGAGAGLLGLLGTSEHSDVLAHLFGFGAGIALGPFLALLCATRRGTRVQIGAGIAAALAVVLAWALAL